MTPRIVITKHRPWLRWTVLGGGAFLLATGAWALYSYTRATTVSDYEAAQSERDELIEERRAMTRDLRAARAEAQELKEQVVYLQQAQVIDTEACSSVRESLKALQAEVSDLQEQVAFYRGIVSPNESRSGVRIYDFKVVPGSSEPGAFRFDLVLIQSVRHDRRVSGRIDISVQGTRLGETETLGIDDLGGQENLLFSFKYFQEFTGEFRLPAGFSPVRATVAVVPDGNSEARVEDVFDWAKIQGA